MRAPAVSARLAIPAGGGMQLLGPRRRHIPRWHACPMGWPAANNGRAPESGLDATCGEPAARIAAATRIAHEFAASRRLRGAPIAFTSRWPVHLRAV